MALTTLNIGGQPEYTGEIVFTSNNDIGPKPIVVTLPLVQLAPSGPLGFIHDGYGLIDITGEILADPATGIFGTVSHPDDTLVSPDINAYYVGAGAVTWKGESDVTARDVGNVNIFELTATIQRLDHWNHRVGIRRKDFAPIEQQSWAVHMVMDEYTAENLKMALLAS